MIHFHMHAHINLALTVVTAVFVLLILMRMVFAHLTGLRGQALSFSLFFSFFFFLSVLGFLLWLASAEYWRSVLLVVFAYLFSWLCGPLLSCSSSNRLKTPYVHHLQSGFSFAGLIPSLPRRCSKLFLLLWSFLNMVCQPYQPLVLSAVPVLEWHVTSLTTAYSLDYIIIQYTVACVRMNNATYSCWINTSLMWPISLHSSALEPKPIHRCFFLLLEWQLLLWALMLNFILSLVAQFLVMKSLELPWQQLAALIFFYC